MAWTDLRDHCHMISTANKLRVVNRLLRSSGDERWSMILCGRVEELVLASLDGLGDGGGFGQCWVGDGGRLVNGRR